MILINSWKIYKSLYSLFLLSIQKRYRETYKEFLEVLIELLFFYKSEIYAEIVSRTSFKEYLKYGYLSHKSGSKLQFSQFISQSLTDIFWKTPFIFKVDSGCPR